MWNLMQDFSDSWLEGTIRAYDGLRRGWSEVFPVQEDPPPTTPFEVVAEYGKLRLRYYRAQGNPQPTPLLLVYALIKRPFILDFQPERSVVETLTRQGFTVYLTENSGPKSDAGSKNETTTEHNNCTEHVQRSVNPGKRSGRGVPDVAGDADPITGYQALVDGQPFVSGGTSAVAPL